ncbi:MAG: endopeptidase La [Clostridia bacterium]|nr:endopeptidase La [Clostridia bacterium]
MLDLQAKTLPIIALRGLVVFPGMPVHFDVGRARSIAAVHEAMSGDAYVFLTAQQDIRVEEPDANLLYPVGCVAKITQILKLPGDGLRVVAEGISRGEIRTVLQKEPFFKGTVMPLPSVGVAAETVASAAMMRSVKEAFSRYAEVNVKLPSDLRFSVAGEHDLGVLTDRIAAEIPFTVEAKQALLGEIHELSRGELVVSALETETELLKLEIKIEQRVRDSMDANQRDYYLREQLNAIAEELGEDDDPKKEAEEYRDRITALDTTDEIKDKLLRESNKLFKMPSGSHEATVVRNYLDSVLELPFGVIREESHDIVAAAEVLEADHYGLKKVKERILELMAVRTLAPDIKGQILCLVGPPGVGKTSIARSIARCLNREYVRISLGGVRDEAEIRGHRRTYIGSMPGRIMEAVRQAKCMNPLILMDEIDKLAADYKGDPAAALLEALDPEQNSTFQDHFLEIPFDLSKVLFVLTANDGDAIPPALRDRMEVITLSSYTREEKYQIAKRHLIPKQIERHGLNAKQFRLSQAALYGLIDGYVKEAGVRNLEREIANLCRKGAKKLVSGEEQVIRIKASALSEYLGPRRYKAEPHVQKGEVGLVNGLAWTSVGGDLLPIETAVFKGSGKIQLTGSLGDVMKESANAAISCIRSRTQILNLPEDFYKENDIHIHAPEGAVPKDGPSAGITMATALISAFSGCAVRRDIAMTGEITIRGRVLPIGGLKEKSMAAYKAGIKTVIIPKENLPDLAEVEDIVKETLTFVGVSTIDEVLPLAFVDESYRKKSAPKVAKRSVATVTPSGVPNYCNGRKA